MRLFAAFFLVLSILIAPAAYARPDARQAGPQPHDGTSPWVKFPPVAAKAAVDTLFLMGGPGSWDGSFETPDGQPDWHGWTHEDATASQDNHWHISTYWAENLGGHGPGNYAMNCVDETIPACAPPDTVGGYGKNWFDDLEWRYSVADTNVAVTVNLTGFMNYDLTDLDWDFLEFFVQRGDYHDMLASWTGTGGDVDTLDFTTVISPGEYSGEGRDEVRLWWRVWSDSAYNDIDCKTPGPGHGAARIDDISVYLDGDLITFDDFEPGSLINWHPTDFTGVGDFTNLRNDLGDRDPCVDNNTWQVNFVDDGVVVPGTDGTPCISYCYDPGGWIVNNDGGLLVDDQRAWFMENNVISPPLAWPPGTDGAELSFDVYVDETLSATAAGVFYQWFVRSTASSDPADLAGAPWRSRNFLYHDNPKFKRHVEPVTDLMEPGRQWVQISLGANEVGWVWNWNGANGTPAPYFDNVELKVWAPEGPEILVTRSNLFTDAFPEAGSLNPANLADNWCRVDIQSTKIVSGTDSYIQGDSLVAVISPLRQGATVSQPGSLHWVLACNPTFDSVRPAVPDAQGLVRGMISGAAALDYYGDPIEGSWSFDFPDTGFFFPGDRLHYYITASDDLAGDVRTAVWPPDTTGVLDFNRGSPFPALTTVRAMPTLTPPTEGNFGQPPLLLCDGANNSEAALAWSDVMHELGMQRGIDYDLLTVNRGYMETGIGALSSVANLSGYQTMIYSAGAHFSSLSGNSWSNDAKLLYDWLETGNRKILLTGDGMVNGLTRSEDGYLLMGRLGIDFHDNDITNLNGDMRDLQVSPAPGIGVLPDNIQWLIDSHCPELRSFDALSPTTTGQAGATLDPEGAPGGPYSALVFTEDPALSNRTAVLPFALDQVNGMIVGSGMKDSSFSPRAHLVNFVLFWLGAGGVSDARDLPGAGRVSVTAHPNPFNPSTTIAFELPRQAEVSLDIYDLQGRLIRRLLDESPHASGAHKQVWDGRDGGGRATSSGVYFYRFNAGDQKRVGKLTLLK